MLIEVIEATPDQKPVLKNLLELYLYDFSEFTGDEVGEDGLYGYEPLEYYWNEPGRHAFLVRVDGKLAGFVLVNQYKVVPDEGETHAMAEFFILRKHRKKGIGEEAARQVLDLFPGKWQVAQIVENPGATAFWRKVIGRYTRGRYTEVVADNPRWQGPVQCFEKNSGG